MDQEAVNNTNEKNKEVVIQKFVFDTVEELMDYFHALIELVDHGLATSEQQMQSAILASQIDNYRTGKPLDSKWISIKNLDNGGDK